MIKNKKNRVVVALSGGVDSSVVAYLLLQSKYEVKAIHVKSWDSFAANDLEGISKNCLQGNDYVDASKICRFLGIDLIKLDLTKEFWNTVFLPSIKMLKKGKTPNPDSFCNKYIKFGVLKKYIKNHFPNFLFATGHYANFNHNKNVLMKAKDEFKDQTYFLAKVKTKSFDDVLFPLGNFTKTQVRRIARDAHLITHDKKDSTGLCFVGERNYVTFLKNFIQIHKGKIINKLTSKEIGEHQGYEFYTIGQNKGLNLGGQKERFCVLEKDIKNNILYVAPINHPINYKTSFIINDINWIGHIDNSLYKRELEVRIRHQGKLHRCFFDQKNAKIKLIKGVKGITPGQEVVFYFNNVVLGGGTIVGTI